MSAVEELGLAFRSMLGRALSAPAVRMRVGLVAASEIWGGVAPRDQPGWYAWLAARPGAFQLDVEDAVRLDLPGAPLLGRLSVRYYPSPSDPDRATFSPEERALAGGGRLDASGAPRVDATSQIPPASFTVGAIECAIDRDGALLAVTMATLDRLRATYLRAWTGESHPLGVVSRSTGERVRDVPGWRITAPLFSSIAGLGALLGGRSAHRLVTSRQRGFETVYERAVAEQRDSDDVVHGEAVLVLRGHETDEVVDAVAASLVDPAGEIVLDTRLPAPDAPARCRDRRLALAVDPAWFADGEAVHERCACSC